MSTASGIQRRGVIALAVLSVLLFARAATGQAVTIVAVNTTGDVADFGGAQQVGDLPGPDGLITLREAVLAASNTPGPETIAFNIPTSDPGFNGTFFTIHIENTPPLILADDATAIDGATQTAFSGDTNPAGPEVFLSGTIPLANMNGLTINSNGNLVTGLGGFSYFRYGIEINGDGNRVTASATAALSAGIHVAGAGNVIGGTAPGAGNVISSGGVGVWIRMASATGNVVQGNTIAGNHSDGVAIENGASGNTIGGTAAGAGNVINANGHLDGERVHVGSQVSIVGDGNVVQGNFLGVDATGTQPLAGSARSGVSLSGSSNLIGGDVPGAGNVIAGHSFPARGSREGVLIYGGANNVIQGNRIGAGADGSAVPNDTGISVDVFLFADVPHDVAIGGAAPGAGNVIAFNTKDGIAIEGSGGVVQSGIAISGNTIVGNGELGIDLGNDGVTPNDPGDGDAGPNGLQNFPVITSAVDGGASTLVSGTIDTPSPQTVAVELFSNDAADLSGFGEGQVFQGATTPDAAGHFAAALPGGLGGKYITAAATDAAGSTSEFSGAALVGGAPVLRSTDITLSARLRLGVVTVNGWVIVKDGNGLAVPGAQVQATWTLPNGTKRDQVATTGTSGVARFSVRGGRGTYTLTVANIVKPGYTFDSNTSVLTKSIKR